MPRKREVMTLSISPEAKANLESIAQSLGITWGDRPNVSRMIEMIGSGDLTVINKANSEIKLSQSLDLIEKSLEAALLAVRQVKKTDR